MVKHNDNGMRSLGPEAMIWPCAAPLLAMRLRTPVMWQPDKQEGTSEQVGVVRRQALTSPVSTGLPKSSPEPQGGLVQRCLHVFMRLTLSCPSKYSASLKKSVLGTDLPPWN